MKISEFGVGDIVVISYRNQNRTAEILELGDKVKIKFGGEIKNLSKDFEIVRAIKSSPKEQETAPKIKRTRKTIEKD